MSTLAWVLTGLLAAVFLGTGFLKLTKPQDELVEAGMPALGELSPEQLRLLGAAEVLGAAGVVLPPLTDVLPWLGPVAAVGLGVVAAGATYLHVRRQEWQSVMTTLPLLALAVAALSLQAVAL